jgi:hypothetical protein
MPKFIGGKSLLSAGQTNFVLSQSVKHYLWKLCKQGVLTYNIYFSINPGILISLNLLYLACY